MLSSFSAGEDGTESKLYSMNRMILINEKYVCRELEFIPATCKVIEYCSQSYGRPSCKEGFGDTEKHVIIKSRVLAALLGKGPASASTVAWTVYQK